MSGFVEMMTVPVLVSLVLVAMHGYLGAHVVRRGVIFIDIALAQMAAFGVAVALLLGAEPGTRVAYAAGLSSTLLGAVLLSFTRTRHPRVPQEAYIGIVYVVFSAAMILVLTQVPHGGDEIRHLLVGAILWVTWPVALETTALYGVLGLLLLWWHRPLSRISEDAAAAQQSGLLLRRWDFLFYLVLGVVVTSSVQIAGVLMVFTLLVVPTVMAMRLFTRTAHVFTHILVTGTLAVVLGAAFSYGLDLPTGAAIVCCFGLLLAAQVIAEQVCRRRA